MTNTRLATREPRPALGIGLDGEGIGMESNRRTALTAGVLFIVATAASLLSSAVERPFLTRTDYLTRVSENANLVSAGGLLEIIAAGASVGIAIALYPVLKRWSAGMALGSVVFRTVEAVMYTASAVSLLSLLTVGEPQPPITPRFRLSAMRCWVCAKSPSWRACLPSQWAP